MYDQPMLVVERNCLVVEKKTAVVSCVTYEMCVIQDTAAAAVAFCVLRVHAAVVSCVTCVPYIESFTD